MNILILINFVKKKCFDIIESMLIRPNICVVKGVSSYLITC